MPADRTIFANPLILIEKMLNKKIVLKIIFWLLLSSLSVTAVTLAGIYLYLSPKLPPVESLKQVKLQTPLRVYSSDEKLIGEFGEQRRMPLKYSQIPETYLKALLSAEDAEFFEHHGISLKGMLRAASQILKSGAIQSGGSTLTQQLARDIFLNRKQVFSRKFNEILLSLQIEQAFTKEEILELFNNKMFFGNRAYGLQAAAQIYYGKDISVLTLAQYAMIVGVLKAPSAYNPLANPKRALIRRNWILGRMLELNYIDKSTYHAAIDEPNTAEFHGTSLEVQAPFVAEMARKEAFDRFGENAYTDGYKIYTTIHSAMQATAQAAIVNGLVSYDERHGYRGAEQKLAPSAVAEFEDWQDQLQTMPALGGLEAVAVLSVAEKSISVLRANGDKINLTWEQGLSNKNSYLSEDSRGPAPKNATDFLHAGDVIRIAKNKDNQWQMSQVPDAESTLIALDPADGAIRSLVGGFDFQKSHFNRAIQGARQPGSSFKPLLYTCALEHGFTPATLINDAPIVITNPYTGAVWRPENDEGKFEGPTRLRQALYRSVNLVSIRVLRSLGVETFIDSLERFGFNKSELPHELSIALGAHAVMPIQMATAYAAFANGGFKVDPYLVTRIENSKGEIVFESKPKRVCATCIDMRSNLDLALAAENAQTTRFDPDLHAPRIIDERVAYVMDSMLKDVVLRGTASAAAKLGRSDLGGKTGTTNGPRDLWFSGYNPNLVATVWVGFDNNTPIGKREFGSTAALPIWMDFMRAALEGQADQLRRQPDGIVTVRINPETGKPAQPGETDTIFEIFPTEMSVNGSEPVGISDAPSNEETLPEGVL
jgi:penicillin-binding protein 1A